jgi:hypothetical protein
MSYVILRGNWFHLIVLNVHAPSEDKIDVVKDSLYKEFDCIFDTFPKYHMKIVLDFDAKVGREDIFKSTIGNESLNEIINNGIQCSYIATFINIFGRLQTGNPTIRLTIC